MYRKTSALHTRLARLVITGLSLPLHILLGISWDILQNYKPLGWTAVWRKIAISDPRLESETSQELMDHLSPFPTAHPAACRPHSKCALQGGNQDNLTPRRKGRWPLRAILRPSRAFWWFWDALGLGQYKSIPPSTKICAADLWSCPLGLKVWPSFWSLNPIIWARFAPGFFSLPGDFFSPPNAASIPSLFAACYE